MQVLRAPRSNSLSLITNTSLYFSGSTASNTLYTRRKTPFRVASLQAFAHAPGIRVTGQLFGVYTAEQLRCGNGKIRLAQYSPAFRYRRKARQNLAAPFGQGRSAENTVRHVTAHTPADPAQLFH